MAAQQQLANAFGGIGRTTSISTPKTGSVAAWQTGGTGYNERQGDRFSPFVVNQPQAQPPPSNLPAALDMGAQSWQQPSWGMDQQQGPAQIQTGIEAPFLQQPGTPQTPNLPDWVDQNAVQANLGTQLAPRQMALQEAYYPAAASLMNDFQSARSKASQGWMGNQIGRQNQLLQAMQGIR